MCPPSPGRLDVGGPIPLYRQVEQQILQCLVDGEWKPGEQLPTETQLARRFGVAVFTIRAGIAELVASQILVRKQGKGTFVARHSRQRQRFQFSHIHDLTGRQVMPGRELRSLAEGTASALEADKLRLSGSDPRDVLRLGMLSVEGGDVIATLDIVVPKRLFGGLTAEAVRSAEENLYALYQDACGINVTAIEESVFADVAGGATATALGLDPGGPVLRVERIAYSYRNVPVEYRIRVFDAARFHYRRAEGSLI